MKLNHMVKGLYYCIRAFADDIDNTVSLLCPVSCREDYLRDCSRNYACLKEKAIENFRLAFGKDLSDKIKP